jgi:hypothetical protein
MKVVVFLGPSLPRAEAEAILPAIYLPPARQSDLMDAVRIHKPDVIALVDSLYRRVPTVWHKEILYALKQGVAVYGASSMGAVRAAETAPFGMIGVGEIHRMYAEGLLDDDEVALVHATEEFGYRPLSEPMVNVRATLERAVHEGLLDEFLCRHLLAVAKAQHFTERTFPSIFQDLADDLKERLMRFCRERYVDLKRRDTVLLLETVRDLPDKPEPRADFELAETIFYHGLQRDRRLGGLRADRIAADFALHASDYEEVRFQCLNRLLVLVLGEMVGLELGSDDVDQEERRFRLSRRIGDLDRWLEDNHCDREEFRGLMRQRAACRKLHHWLLSKGHRRATLDLLDELRLAGRFKSALSAADNREHIVSGQHPDFPDRGEYDLPEMGALLVEHLRSTDARMTAHFPDWAEEAGFMDRAGLKLELARSRLFRQALHEMMLQVLE